MFVTALTMMLIVASVVLVTSPSVEIRMNTMVKLTVNLTMHSTP